MTLQKITQNIIERSKASREAYLVGVDDMRNQPPAPDRLSCSNWAHVVAAESAQDKKAIPAGQGANIGIVSAYNDMLSAHQPFASYPAAIKLAARSAGATAQVAGGVPAMCDGVTQGQPGMELSLFSRDVIAMATAVSLSHDVYDGVMCLGVCDKIVPGLVIGSLQFGHLPVMFVPAGPMPSGIPNKEKALARQKFASGEIDKSTLLETESASYHSAGTCTFYGTANTNQTLMEALGLQLAGTSFVNPATELRKALTQESVARLLNQTSKGSQYTPIAEVVTEKSIVNAMVMMMATGGSTNLTLHLIAMANAAGVQINWQDMDEISKLTPLLAKVYPNGEADVNHFEQAGGLAVLVSQLRSVGLLNEEVVNVMGQGLDAYSRKPYLNDEKKLAWGDAVTESSNTSIVSSMPELHKLTPYLGILQDKGHKVALVTDGRMSGASGKVLAAIHLSPEAKNGGLLAYLQEGDVISINCKTGELSSVISESELRKRKPAIQPQIPQTLGRGLFEKMRDAVGDSTLGASSIN